MSELVPMDAIEPAPEPGPSKGKKGGRPRTMALRSGIIKDKLLQGVSEHYCRHFARSEWNVTPACARRYVYFAKKLIGAESKPFTEDIFLDHLAMRRNLRTVAFNAKDYKLFHEILKDEAELLNLYEQRKKPPVATPDEPKRSAVEEVLLSPEATVMVTKPADPATS